MLSGGELSVSGLALAAGVADAVDACGEIGGGEAVDLHFRKPGKRLVVAHLPDLPATHAHQVEMVGEGKLIEGMVGVDEKPPQDSAFAQELDGVVDRGPADVEILVDRLVELVDLEVGLQGLSGLQNGETLRSLPKPFLLYEFCEQLFHSVCDMGIWKAYAGSFRPNFTAKIIAKRQISK